MFLAVRIGEVQGELIHLGEQSGRGRRLLLQHILGGVLRAVSIWRFRSMFLLGQHRIGDLAVVELGYQRASWIAGERAELGLYG